MDLPRRHTGAITLIGASTIRANDISECSVLTIGGVELQNIAYKDYLRDYLAVALVSRKSVTCFIHNNCLYAIHIRDKIYRDDSIFRPRRLAFWLLLLSFTPFILLTAPSLLYLYAWHRPRAKIARDNLISEAGGSRKYEVVWAAS